MELGLEMMVKTNNSQYGTAFTVTIEAAKGVTTGVSAADRVTTIKAAIANGATSDDIASPGHVFFHLWREPEEFWKGTVTQRQQST